MYFDKKGGCPPPTPFRKFQAEVGKKKAVPWRKKGKKGVAEPVNAKKKKRRNSLGGTRRGKEKPHRIRGIRKVLGKRSEKMSGKEEEKREGKRKISPQRPSVNGTPERRQNVCAITESYVKGGKKKQKKKKEKKKKLEGKTSSKGSIESASRGPKKRREGNLCFSEER